MRILHIPNNCSATGHLLFLGWGGIRATTGNYDLKTVSKNALHALKLGHTRTDPTVSKQKFDYSFLCLLGLEDQIGTTEDIVVHLDAFGSPQHDSTRFRGK